MPNSIAPDFAILPQNISRRKLAVASQRPPKILIIRLGAIGDVANVAPALTALRDHIPQAHIAWLVEDKASGMVDLFSDLDEKIVFPRRRWQSAMGNPCAAPKAIVEFGAFVRRLRGRRFDVSLDFQGNLKSAMLGWLAGAKQRVGYAEGFCRESNFHFTQHHYAPSGSRVRRPDRHLALLRHFNIDAKCRLPRVRIPQAAEDEVQRFIEQHVEPGRPIVAMHPGASGFADFKRWPAEKYARLADRLAADHNCAVVLTWGPGEQGAIEHILSAMRKSAVALTGEPALAKMAALYRASSLVIAADTGPLHLAAIVGAPVVGIYGPKDVGLYAPAGDRYTIVRPSLPCSPCSRRRCPGSACMRSVRVETVLDAAADMLAGAAHLPAIHTEPRGLIARARGSGQPPYGLWPVRDGRRFKSGFFAGLASHAGAQHDLLTRTAQPDSFFDQPGTRFLDDSAHSKAGRVPMRAEIGNEMVLVKHYTGIGVRRGWIGPAARSRAQAEWTAARRLIEAGLPAPTPLVVAERRRWGVLSEACYIAADAPGAVALSEVLGHGNLPAESRKRLIAALATLAARFHTSGFRGPGLGLDSLLVGGAHGAEPELWLWSAESVTWRQKASRRASLRDLRRWAKAFAGVLSSRDRARFAILYTRAEGWPRGDARVFARSIKGL